MPRYNPDVVARCIGEIRKGLSRLKAFGELPQEDFLKDPDKVDSAKYNLIVVIESAIDLCNHLISCNGFRIPRDYADTFEVLREQGIFDEGLALRLKAMARFRNRLVHLYWEVDNETLYRILRENLGDLVLFLKSIADFLDL